MASQRNAEDAADTAAAAATSTAPFAGEIPPGDAPKSKHPLITTIALIFGVIAYQLGATMVAPALPHIAMELGVETTAVAQVTALFFLAGSISGVVATRWADFIGRRNALLIVIGIAVVGSVLAMLSPNLEVLLVARVLQGIACGSFQITFVVLGGSLTGRQFAIAVAVISAINGGVAGFDGVLGGWLADTYGFRSLFAVILVVGILALIAVYFFVPTEQKPASQGRMDWWGAVLMALVLIAATNTVSSGSKVGWLTPDNLMYIGLLAVSVVVFTVVERRRRTPLIDPRHIVSRQVWPLLATVVLYTMAFSAVIYFTIVLYAQNAEIGFGLPASLAALMFITPAAVLAAVCSPLTGWITTKIGWTPTCNVGLALSATVIAIIAIFPSQMWLISVVLATLGITYKGMAIAPTNGLGVLLSPKDAPGALPGLVGACFGIGNGLGVTTVAATVGAGTMAGFTSALWISFTIAALAFFTSLLIPKPTVDVTI